MLVHNCLLYPDCNFKTEDVISELTAVMLKIHADGDHSVNSQTIKNLS
ncbi:MAG: hypothetical protein AAFO91_19370 [Bacteroidota bacterium]